MTKNRGAIELQGFKELLRDFERLPEELKKEVRNGADEVATTITNEVQRLGATKQATPLLNAVKVGRRQRIPSMKIGGNARAGVSGGAKLSELLGANFGTHGKHPQFPKRANPDHYVYRHIERRSQWITRTWLDNLARALALVDPANRGRT